MIKYWLFDWVNNLTIWYIIWFPQTWSILKRWIVLIILISWACFFIYLLRISQRNFIIKINLPRTQSRWALVVNKIIAIFRLEINIVLVPVFWFIYSNFCLFVRVESLLKIFRIFCFFHLLQTNQNNRVFIKFLAFLFV